MHVVDVRRGALDGSYDMLFARESMTVGVIQKKMQGTFDLERIFHLSSDVMLAFDLMPLLRIGTEMRSFEINCCIRCYRTSYKRKEKLSFFCLVFSFLFFSF